MSSLIGTCNTIANVVDSYRKCRKAKKKITPLVEEALASLLNIKKRAPQVTVFVELGGISMDTFGSIARRIVKVEEVLLKLGAKLKSMNKTIHTCFCKRKGGGATRYLHEARIH